MEAITTVTPILRFNFSEEVMAMIADFAKVHRFDDRHAYKEHWEAWFEENNDELALEIYRLEKNGYKGDISKGMTLTARFLIANRSLWQLLYDKVDNWLNPKFKSSEAK